MGRLQHGGLPRGDDVAGHPVPAVPHAQNPRAVHLPVESAAKRRRQLLRLVAWKGMHAPHVELDDVLMRRRDAHAIYPLGHYEATVEGSW